MTTSARRSDPWHQFLVLGSTQALSQTGTLLTSFALGVWVYRTTGSVELYSLLAVFASLPGIFVLPLAGALVDRIGRRKAMLIGDSGSALATMCLWFLLASEHLGLVLLCAAVAVASLFESLRAPGWSAALRDLVPPQRLNRAAGLVQFGSAFAETVAPLAAGVLLLEIDYSGVLLIDLATFVVALVALLGARFPELPPRRLDGGTTVGDGLRAEIGQGWRWVRRRPPLFGLLLFFGGINFVVAYGYLLVTPLVLATGSAARLGLVLSAGGVGLISGGALMSVWGGPGDRMWGVLGFAPLLGLGLTVLGLRPGPWWAMSGIFLLSFAVPPINACNHALWSAKVPHELQGRVFALSRMVSYSTAPVAYLAAGAVAARWFEPLLAVDGPLAATWVADVLGTGPGRGLGLLLSVSGVALAVASGLVALNRPLRRLDRNLKDSIDLQRT